MEIHTNRSLLLVGDYISTTYPLVEIRGFLIVILMIILLEGLKIEYLY